MSKIPMTTLELRTARDAQHTAEVAVQFLASLPNPPSSIFAMLKQAPTFFFEMLNQGQVTYFLLTFPSNYLDYVKSQLTATYPEILIKELEHNPLSEFTSELPKKAGRLKLTSASYFSLKTFQEFSETDPLSAVLSTLSKTLEGDSVLIQFAMRKAKESWKNTPYTYISQGIKQADNTYLPHPQKAEIEQKINQAGLQTSIRVLVQSQHQPQVDNLFQTVTHAFSAFDSQHNHLEVKIPTLRKQKLLEEILTRSDNLPNQFFSLSEIATLYHLPNQQLSTIRNIAWGKNLLGEPPELLPYFERLTEEERENANLFGATEFKNQSRIFGIKEADLRRHFYVIGKSGTGKSTLLANMIINDLKHNKGLGVIDPHGDLVETVLN